MVALFPNSGLLVHPNHCIVTIAIREQRGAQDTIVPVKNSLMGCWLLLGMEC